ncbi:unnamed protein product [Trichobilharzia szidati]|nr:unnamed protein product [Trichobilharzia szidati]
MHICTFRMKKFSAEHFILLFLLLCPCRMFILPKNIGNISSESAFFISNWLLSAHNFSVVSDPLVDDVDLDGKVDVYFSTVDGTLYGIKNVFKCITERACTTYHGNWPIMHTSEIFFSPPHSVDLYGNGEKLIIFTSHHGTVFVYDHLGNTISHFQIPDIILDRNALFTENLDQNLMDSIRWASVDDDDRKKNLRLHPLVYGTPQLLTTIISPLSENIEDANNFLYTTDLIHIAVNFITYPYDPIARNESTLGVLVATVVNIPRCALLQPSLQINDADSCLPHFKVLEVDWLSSKMPPYIFSSPTISANLFEETRVKEYYSQIHSYYSFITTFSGKLHVVKLSALINGKEKKKNKRKKGERSADVISIAYTLRITPTSFSCIPSPCPRDKTNQNVVFLQSTTGVRSCCLLLDIHSCLRLVHILPMRAYNRHPQIYWTYCPIVASSSSSSLNVSHEQVSQVTVVPGCQQMHTCSPWSVYTTPDGYAHAIDIETGLPASGYPINLYAGFPNATDLSTSTGLLYQREDMTYWMLFTDAYSNLIHLRLHNPFVTVFYNGITTTTTNNSSHQHMPVQSSSSSSSGTSSYFTRLVPFTILKSSKSPSFLLLSRNGLQVMTSKSFQHASMPTSLMAYSKNTDKPVVHYADNERSSLQFITVEFVNDQFFDPVESVTLNANKKTISYLIKDCSFHHRHHQDQSNAASSNVNQTRLAKRFLVRLVTSFGVPLSHWSIVYVTPNSDIKQCGACDCTIGYLSVENTPIGQHISELYLSVIDSTSGYFISFNNDYNNNNPRIIIIQSLWICSRGVCFNSSHYWCLSNSVYC